MTDQGILHHQRQLIQYLTIGWEKQGLQVQLFETHISWVLVAGNVAYKFKKAVHVDFLDFSTLDARHFYCREEVRLNRRLSPSLYPGVVAITGSLEYPLIDAPGTPLEYAVKMRAFPQQALWRYRLETRLISPEEIDALAGKIARAAAAPSAGLYDSTVTQLTYRRLRMLARQVVDAGLPVIVDAAFLRKEQRCLFEELAQDLGVPFLIFMMQASEIAMKERIAARAQRDQDPSDAGLHVLARQMTEHDPLSDDEIRHAIVVDSNLCMDIQLIRKIADPVIRMLRRS